MKGKGFIIESIITNRSNQAFLKWRARLLVILSEVFELCQEHFWAMVFELVRVGQRDGDDHHAELLEGSASPSALV